MLPCVREATFVKNLPVEESMSKSAQPDVDQVSTLLVDESGSKAASWMTVVPIGVRSEMVRVYPPVGGAGTKLGQLSLISHTLMMN